jgi:predicted  nucleic acid-binding Zn-ribbon protein
MSTSDGLIFDMESELADAKTEHERAVKEFRTREQYADEAKAQVDALERKIAALETAILQLTEQPS